MVEGGSPAYCIDDPSPYWEDLSYIQVSSESEADKIYYPKGEQDHSAIKSNSVSGKYVSKWAGGPLMLHAPGYGPDEYYMGDGPKYYKRNYSSISGPDVVCYSNSQFSLTDPPSGAIYWTAEPSGIFTVPSSGNPINISLIYPSTNSVTLSAFNQNNQEIARKTIMPCLQINGPSEVCYTGSQFVLNDTPSGTIYWTVDNTSLFSVTSPGSSTTVKRIGIGTGSATLSAHIGSVNADPVATKTITACTPAVISGNYHICSSAYFSLSSPHKADGGWTVSPQNSIFSISSYNNTSATVTVSPQNAASTQATLIADVSGTQISIPITNCALLGSNFLCPTTSYYINNGASAVWNVTSGFSITPYDGNVCASVTASAPNLTGTVTAVANGTTYSMNISSCDYDVYGRGGSGGAVSYVSVRPNPASTVLIIEIDENAAAQSRATLPSNEKVAGVASPTYDVRLYNMSGELVRNEKTKNSSVNFDVSTLPNGFYFLHVYDGIAYAPEVHKVMINH